jgi:hypothetical protein
MKTKPPPLARYTYDFPRQMFRFQWPEGIADKLPHELAVPLTKKPDAIDSHASKEYAAAQKQLERIMSQAHSALKGPCDFVLVDALLDPVDTPKAPTQTSFF